MTLKYFGEDTMEYYKSSYQSLSFPRLFKRSKTVHLVSTVCKLIFTLYKKTCKME